jgi:exopolyphosphatase/guanosine-5'-triphosphate,3'-diphosphate pyrophosphatase
MEHLIGLIDLGSNTARLVVYSTDGQGLIVEHDNMKQPLRLISYIQDNGTISDTGFKKTLDCMLQFKHLCTVRNVNEIIGVATAAVRQATNGQELLHHIETLTGIQFQLLTGEQEAYYGYLAIVNSMNMPNAISVDMGGGSTEITLIRDRMRIASTSLPFGVVTLTEQFLYSSVPSDEELGTLHRFLSQQLSPFTWLTNCRLPLVAMGGTARNVAKIHQKRAQYSLPSFHHYVIKPSEVKRLYHWIRQLPMEARRQVPGLSKDRADVIIAGMAVFQTLLQIMKAKQFVTSNKGLRDGILFERMLSQAGSPIVEDVAMFSVKQFMKRYRVDAAHAMQVRYLATRLFDDCKKLKLHNFGSEKRRILELAAMLHDCGRSINVFNTAEHTYYLLSNVLLPGLTHRERLLVAMVASYKNQKLLQRQVAEHADIVFKSDKSVIELLGSLLQLARSLDRSMTQPIRSVQIREKKDHLRMHCETSNPNAMEFQFIQDAVERFAKAIKRPVQISVDVLESESAQSSTSYDTR